MDFEFNNSEYPNETNEEFFTNYFYKEVDSEKKIDEFL